MEVAAYSSVIGENLKGLDADKALLCGLLNDIGVFPVVAAVDDRVGIEGDTRVFESVVQRVRNLVGSMLLSRWEMDKDLVNAVEDAENWFREGSTRPDYTDVVQVAQLHSFIGTPRALRVPDMEEIRSFRKIAGSPASPRFGIALKHAGKRRLAAWEQTLERLMSNRRPV
jgi:HD-like signal output (HDOD) protein